jgi:hypothetical protein
MHLTWSHWLVISGCFAINFASDWLTGCAMIYLTLFGIGKILFGQAWLGLAFLGLAALADGYVYWDLNRCGWSVLDDKT